MNISVLGLSSEKQLSLIARDAGPSARLVRGLPAADADALLCFGKHQHFAQKNADGLGQIAYLTDGKPCITTYTFGEIAKSNFVLKAYALRHMKKLLAVGPAYDEPCSTMEVDENIDWHIDLLKYLADKPPRVVSIDFETITPTEISNIGLAYYTTEGGLFAQSVPLTLDFNRTHSPSAVAEVLRLLLQIMRKHYIVMHNGVFDLSMAMQVLDDYSLRCHADTMVIGNILHPDYSHGLANMCNLMFNPQPWKHLGKFTKGNTQSGTELALYNAMDAGYTLQLYESLMEEAEGFNNPRLLGYLSGGADVHKWESAFSCIGLGGLAIGKKEFEEEFCEQLRMERTDSEESFRDVYGINPSSPKQVKEYVESEFRIPLVSSDRNAIEEVMKRLRLTPDQAIFFSALLAYRDKAKLHSTYGGIKMSPTRLRQRWPKRIFMPYSVNPAGTVSGRISTSATVWGIGSNVQNLPPEFKKVVLPMTDDHVLVEIDLAQAEERVVAWESLDSNLLIAFESGKDTHKMKAAWLYKVDYDAVTKEQRQAAKRDGHAFNYGMSAAAYARLHHIALREAEERRTMYLSAFPMIERWWSAVRSQIMCKGYVENCFGRIRRFVPPYDDHTWKSAYSYVPQSTVAEVINRALFDLYEKTLDPYYGARVYLYAQVHDSLLFSVEKSISEEIIALALSSLEQPFTVRNAQRRFVAEAKMGSTWADLRTITRK